MGGRGVELFIGLSRLLHLKVHQPNAVTDCHAGKVESGNLLTLTAWTAFYGQAAARGRDLMRVPRKCAPLHFHHAHRDKR